VPDDPRALDALLEDRGGGWWSACFADRAKDSASPCPFLVGWPDESLVAWFSQGLLAPGRVLELGCGNGRNAVHLASLGCTVDAVDFSERAVELTRQRARSAAARRRQRRETDGKDRCFGQGFLWVLLAGKRR